MPSEPVKICFVIDAMNVGGTEKQLIEIINGLDSNRFKTYLVCLQDSKMFRDTELRCTKRLFPVSSFKKPSTLLQVLRFRKFLNKERIDIVQTFFLDANIFGTVAAKLSKVKKIISSRRDLGFWYTRKNLRVLSVINPMADRFMVNAEAIKVNVAKVEGVDSGRIDVLYNGIDPELYRQERLPPREELKEKFGIPDAKIVVGCVANFNRAVKRIDLLIDIAAIVAKEYDNVVFAIAGSGHLKKELEAQAKRLKVQDKVHFIGQQQNIPEVIKTFDIGILTSDSEGLSNSILEYMASGVPTVATSVGGNPELIEHGINGFLAPAGEPDGLAAYVMDLLKSKELRDKLGKNAAIKVQELFSIDKMITGMEEYYCSIL